MAKGSGITAYFSRRKSYIEPRRSVRMSPGANYRYRKNRREPGRATSQGPTQRGDRCVAVPWRSYRNLYRESICATRRGQNLKSELLSPPGPTLRSFIPVLDTTTCASGQKASCDPLNGQDLRKSAVRCTGLRSAACDRGGRLLRRRRDGKLEVGAYDGPFP